MCFLMQMKRQLQALYGIKPREETPLEEIERYCQASENELQQLEPMCWCYTPANSKTADLSLKVRRFCLSNRLKVLSVNLKMNQQHYKSEARLPNGLIDHQVVNVPCSVSSMMCIHLVLHFLNPLNPYTFQKPLNLSLKPRLLQSVVKPSVGGIRQPSKSNLRLMLLLMQHTRQHWPTA